LPIHETLELAREREPPAARQDSLDSNVSGLAPFQPGQGEPRGVERAPCKLDGQLQRLQRINPVNALTLRIWKALEEDRAYPIAGRVAVRAGLADGQDNCAIRFA